MSNSQTYQRRVGPNHQATIAAEEGCELNGPLFAINWFDTRRAWVYHLYNRLAAVRVFKVGGKVLLKGKTGKSLGGDETLRREFLLIVNYPSAQSFLDLVSDKVFQFVGMLRTAAVQRFSFVFHTRQEGVQLLSWRTQRLDDRAYAVLHFEPEGPLQTQHQTLKRLAGHAGLDVHFYGIRTARLGLGPVDADPKWMRNVTPHTMVVTAESERMLADFVRSEEVGQALKACRRYFVAAFERLL